MLAFGWSQTSLLMFVCNDSTETKNQVAECLGRDMPFNIEIYIITLHN